jgi:cytochrome c-type biogenesis protein CcmF
MPELGELCLWAALPLAGLAAVSSFGAAARGRGGLARAGGRAAVATAALLVISLVALGVALVSLRLTYAYVAEQAPVGEPWLLRLAALWSGPAGAALTLTSLLAAVTALSHRGHGTHVTVARTGSLAVLVLLGLLLLVVRARPFAPATLGVSLGAGLAQPLRDLAWQVEIWALYLAIACSAFSFAGTIGGQLAAARGPGHRDRDAVRLVAGFLSVAALAAAWRVYAASGRLLDLTGAGEVAVHAPGLCLAFAYLHAPGGSAVPAWADRWRQVLAIALFPTVLGDGAALLAGAGGPAAATLWAGGLATGILSGALAGLGRAPRGIESLRSVPGFDAWALQGGVYLLLFAGLVAVWGLWRGRVGAQIIPAAALVMTATAGAWSGARPAGRRRRVGWAVALVAVASGGAAAALADRVDTAFVLAAACAGGVGAGLVAEAMRLRSARAAQRLWAAGTDASALIRARARRRWSSVFGHVGLAAIVLGLAADGLRESTGRVIVPGQALAAPAGPGPQVRLTYLGLSRYQVGALDRQVASFSLHAGDAPPRLVAAARTWDPISHRERSTPALQRGWARDVFVAVAEVRGSESILCTVTSRPLAGLVWLGALLVAASVFAIGRTSL